MFQGFIDHHDKLVIFASSGLAFCLCLAMATTVVMVSRSIGLSQRLDGP